MANLNHVVLLGTVGKAPEQRFMQSGETFCNFNLAQNYFKKKQGEEQSVRTEWFRVCAFGEIAQRCIDHLEKGTQVIVEGRLKSGSYEKNGQTIKTVEIIAEKIHPFVRKKGANGSYQRSKPNGDPGYASVSQYSSRLQTNHSDDEDEKFNAHYQPVKAINEDDIPF